MKQIIPILIALVLTGCTSAEKYLANANESARNDNFDEALANVDKAIEKDAENVEALMFRADLLMVMDRGEEAIPSYRAAYNLTRDDRILFRWGKAALDYGLYEEANAALTPLLESSRGMLVNDAKPLVERARFGMEQIENPVEFDPQNMGPNINTLDMQYFPAVTADGETMMFTTRDLSATPPDEDFYVSSYNESTGEWSRAEPLPGRLNTYFNEGAMSLSADGNVIFYTGCQRQDAVGRCDIYVSFKRPDGTWTEGRNLGPNINTEAWESQPSISPDGRTLFFVRGRASNADNTDIYYSVWNGRSWSTAEKLPGSVNTPSHEETPFIHFDGKTMYFASDGHLGMGESDLFVAELLPDSTWGNVRNLGYPINTFEDELGMIVAPDGRTAYYASDRDQMRDRQQLYTFTLPESVRATPIAWVKGIVVDDATGEPVDGSLRFVDTESSRVLLSERSGDDGTFQVSLPAFSSYAVNVNGEGYLFYSETFSLEDQTDATAERLEIRLKKLSVGDAAVLRNVYFDTDSYEVGENSKVELKRLVEFMKENATVRLAIDGHTDNQGSSAYNRTLSENRAGAIVNYLVTQGIERDRLVARGFGDSKPRADNSTEEGRAQNRRTEITILDL